MYIKKVLYQNRRDFKAVYKCEKCGFEKTDNGYDDRNFHDNVIPKMKCDKCGETSISLGSEITNTKTKYPEGLQI